MSLIMVPPTASLNMHRIFDYFITFNLSVYICERIKAQQSIRQIIKKKYKPTHINAIQTST